MVHVQATIPFLPANAPVGTQVPGFSTIPEKVYSTGLSFRPRWFPHLIYRFPSASAMTDVCDENLLPSSVTAVTPPTSGGPHHRAG